MSPQRPVRLRPPRHLSRDARRVWITTVEELARAHTLTEATLPAIERYSAAVARWREAQRQISASGVIVEASRSRVPQISAWHSVARQASAEAAKIERELGLLPARRANVAETPRSLRADGSRRPPGPWDTADVADGDE